ncbi:hypothetical protein PUV54_02280 [Hyphococcus flavus]|uniref:EF-hand domain-containing protein n=1 Tax=Hyphococcus flavus TaxID=1866326 RepID=A0AAE9ZJ46_9PROT|nr:hypothetical protein [Hyphococcus flavus]WDI32016.1 hypothetical protein PUV54_02280 [Hyphococcus flavus]
MKKTTFALIAGASALAAASAFAEHHEKKGEMDWEAKLEAKFAEVDANGDGNVSGEEYLAYKRAEAEKEWTKWAEAAGDDGMVSLDEAKAHHEAKMAEKAAMKKEKKDGGE